MIPQTPGPSAYRKDTVDDARDERHLLLVDNITHLYNMHTSGADRYRTWLCMT